MLRAGPRERLADAAAAGEFGGPGARGESVMGSRHDVARGAGGAEVFPRGEAGGAAAGAAAADDGGGWEAGEENDADGGDGGAVAGEKKTGKGKKKKKQKKR
jgi:hypothetical protein